MSSSIADLPIAAAAVVWQYGRFLHLLACRVHIWEHDAGERMLDEPLALAHSNASFAVICAEGQVGRIGFSGDRRRCIVTGSNGEAAAPSPRRGGRRDIGCCYWQLQLQLAS